MAPKTALPLAKRPAISQRRSPCARQRFSEKQLCRFFNSPIFLPAKPTCLRKIPQTRRARRRFDCSGRPAMFFDILAILPLAPPQRQKLRFQRETGKQFSLPAPAACVCVSAQSASFLVAQAFSSFWQAAGIVNTLAACQKSLFDKQVGGGVRFSAKRRISNFQFEPR